MDPAKPTYAFTCDCGRNFSYRKHYLAHKRKAHNEQTPSRVKPQKTCPLCSYIGTTYDHMKSHFERLHDINFLDQEMSFSSETEFEAWKTLCEKETCAKYVKKDKTVNTKNYTVIKYSCHRSGRYLSGSKGLRSSRRRGSAKINAFCPARIWKKTNTEGIMVRFTNTHIGHEMDEKHVPLSRLERGIIAEKIAQNVSFDDILLELKGSNRVTRKDLHNIKMSLKLDACAHDNVSANTEVDINDQLEERRKAAKVSLMGVLDSLQTVEEIEAVEKAIESFRNADNV